MKLEHVEAMIVHFVALRKKKKNLGFVAIEVKP